MELLDLLLDQDPCGLGELIQFFYPDIIPLKNPGCGKCVGVTAV